MLGGWISLAGRQNAAGSAALGNFDNKLIGLVPPERESRKKKRLRTNIGGDLMVPRLFGASQAGGKWRSVPLRRRRFFQSAR